MELDDEYEAVELTPAVLAAMAEDEATEDGCQERFRLVADFTGSVNDLVKALIDHTATCPACNPRSRIGVQSESGRFNASRKEVA